MDNNKFTFGVKPATGANRGVLHARPVHARELCRQRMKVYSIPPFISKHSADFLHLMLQVLLIKNERIPPERKNKRHLKQPCQNEMSGTDMKNDKVAVIGIPTH